MGFAKKGSSSLIKKPENSESKFNISNNPDAQLISSRPSPIVHNPQNGDIVVKNPDGSFGIAKQLKPLHNQNTGR